MRQKLITALSLLFAFAFLLSAQFNHVSAIVNLYPTPSTSPTTSPVTGPVTGPVTSPSTLFRISGNVTYHIIGLFIKAADRFKPAPGVTVTAKDIFNGHSASAMTDSNGNYVIDPGQKGFYKVTVSGGTAKFYAPPVQFVNLTQNKPTKSNVNYQGLIFKF